MDLNINCMVDGEPGGRFQPKAVAPGIRSPRELLSFLNELCHGRLLWALVTFLAPNRPLWYFSGFRDGGGQAERSLFEREG